MIRRKHLAKILLVFVLLFPFQLQSEDLMPAASLTERTYQFGSVVEGTRISHDFVLKNNGNAPLVIEKIKTG